VRPSPHFDKRRQSEAEALNLKGRLNELLSRQLGRPLTRDDCLYQSAAGQDGRFTCTLVLACAGGQSYVGEACAQRKESEQSAAAVALSAPIRSPPAWGSTPRLLPPGPEASRRALGPGGRPAAGRARGGR